MSSNKFVLCPIFLIHHGSRYEFSGLDSYQAAQVLETLRKLADQGKTVIAVVHQPSQHTFQLFDDLLLLSEGKLMYFGEISNVRNYMAEIGYEAEAEVGTAEHILNWFEIRRERCSVDQNCTG